jgi:6-phosphogluconate dehydrogenase
LGTLQGKIVERYTAWRREVNLEIHARINNPGMNASFSYFDTYIHARLLANLVLEQGTIGKINVTPI